MIIRDAVLQDCESIAALVKELGYDRTADQIAERLTLFSQANEPPIVADDGAVVGCLTWHVTPVLHRPRPVGRITMLVVASRARGRGIGRALVAAAEARVLERGCGLIEVTSNQRRLDAHAFYERLGYERTSYRFARQLG